MPHDRHWPAPEKQASMDITFFGYTLDGRSYYIYYIGVMEDYPKTLLEFEKRFTTEEACLEYLYQIRWPNVFACPFCGHRKYWGSSIGQYRCSNCDRRISLTAGTIFQDSRIPLQIWFQAIWQLVRS